MPDRKKVIQWLEACSCGCEDGCPYEYDGLVHHVECKADLMKDALELLKEQEPVEPVEKRNRGFYYACGSCGKPLGIVLPSYCQYCGKAVKWDAAD